jgi:hypothetical protein
MDTIALFNYSYVTIEFFSVTMKEGKDLAMAIWNSRM